LTIFVHHAAMPVFQQESTLHGPLWPIHSNILARSNFSIVLICPHMWLQSLFAPKHLFQEASCSMEIPAVDLPSSSDPNHSREYCILRLPSPSCRLLHSTFASPIPILPHSIRQYGPCHAGRIDYTVVTVVGLFYPLIHPDCDDVPTDPATGLRSVSRSFVNLAIVLDVSFPRMWFVVSQISAPKLRASAASFWNPNLAWNRLNQLFSELQHRP
jgi:hypothetical protein